MFFIFLHPLLEFLMRQPRNFYAVIGIGKIYNLFIRFFFTGISFAGRLIFAFLCVKINSENDMVELYDKDSNKLIETIPAQDLMVLMQKMNTSTGIFVNKKV